MLEYYQTKTTKHKEELHKIQKTLKGLSAIRFAIFCITVAFTYLLWGNTKGTIVSLILGVFLFVFFLKKYLKHNQQKKLLQKLIAINQTEIDCLKGNYFHLDGGEDFIDPTHLFSYDIDLFGKGSFFQFINRTATKKGRATLSTLLTNNHIDDIEQKQEIIQELSKKTDWRQLFYATASLIEVTTPVAVILKWIENHKSLFSKHIILFSNVFSMVSLVLLSGVVFGFGQLSYVSGWFFIGLTISGRYIKKVNTIHKEATKTTSTFHQYYQILELVENEQFTCKTLQEKQKQLQVNNKKASDVFKSFSKLLDALDQRNNIIVAVVRNGLFLSDMRQASKIETWIKDYKNTVREWFDIITFFDTQNSLANFSFNHSDFVFPEITNTDTIVDTKNIGHPLLHKSKRINNNYSIDSQSFFIITGSNMAGKSTFLRTVSLNIVLANMGLPVCAEAMKYKPIKLITSMRTSDSLTENTSYFFAEIKRLKFIINTIKNEPYFILLDEILKGTNSVDKANGSQKFVEKLIKSKATGIIATHDLSLCKITDTYSEIENYYFDSEVINNELVFDYKLKDGVCKNMNASFLLKKMEII